MSEEPTPQQIANYFKAIDQAFKDGTINKVRPMFTSELVEQLQKIMERYGDVGVFVGDREEVKPLQAILLNRGDERTSVELVA